MGCKYMGYDFRCSNKKVPEEDKVDGYRCIAYVNMDKALDEDIFLFLDCKELSDKVRGGK